MKKIWQRKRIWGLIGLFVINFALRFYQVGQLPKILNRDEAALAYNGYLLSQTGQDEWQQAWPLSLKSFGDYKLPGYVFVLAGLFKFLPLTAEVVRLPSILAGSGLAILGFFFAKALKIRERWAWLVAILFTFTPVFFFYSRMAFEANLALNLFVFSLVMFLTLSSAKKRLIMDFLGLTSLLLAVFTYNTPLLLLPFLFPVLIFHRGWHSWQKWLLPLMGMGLIFTLASLQLALLATQKSAITIFQDETIWLDSVSYRLEFMGIWQKLLGNKYAYFLILILKNYLKSFSPQFLLKAKGGHPWHSLPGSGHLLNVTYFFGLLGILATAFDLLGQLILKRDFFFQHLHKQQKQLKSELLLFYLLLISLLPAVVTVDAPHATRSLFFFFIFIFFSWRGLKLSYHFIRDHTQIKKTALVGVFCLLLIFSGSKYLRLYLQNYPLQQAALQPGFDSIIKQVETNFPNQEVGIVDPGGYQYILLAWYLKITPQEFFKTTIRQQPDKIGFNYGQQVSHYHFIANLADRSPEEKVVVKWNELLNQWEVLEY